MISLRLEFKDFEVPAIPCHMIDYNTISFGQKMRTSRFKGEYHAQYFSHDVHFFKRRIDFCQLTFLPIKNRIIQDPTAPSS